MNKIITFWCLALMVGTTFLNEQENVIYEVISADFYLIDGGMEDLVGDMIYKNLI